MAVAGSTVVCMIGEPVSSVRQSQILSGPWVDGTAPFPGGYALGFTVGSTDVGPVTRCVNGQKSHHILEEKLLLIAQ